MYSQQSFTNQTLYIDTTRAIALRDGNEGNYLEFFQTPFILLKDLEKSILCVFLVRHDGTSHEIRKCNSVDECKIQLFTRKLSHAHTRLKNVI